MSMKIKVLPDKAELGLAAASYGARRIRKAVEKRGGANIIVATGASQFETLAALIREPGIAWDKVNIFHLDEYVGMEIRHPASFRRYLWERLHRKLPLPPNSFCYINGEEDPVWEAQRAGELISQYRIDVAFVGIGENGHLAFNDPPADFETEEPYIVVDLDKACRLQQLGEGWFKTLEEVPQQAISMSIRQIMKSRHLVVAVPDARKASAVVRTVEGPVTNTVPASILQEHKSCSLFLDPDSSKELK